MAQRAAELSEAGGQARYRIANVESIGTHFPLGNGMDIDADGQTRRKVRALQGRVLTTTGAPAFSSLVENAPVLQADVTNPFQT
jgi:hypothetical protein